METVSDWIFYLLRILKEFKVFIDIPWISTTQATISFQTISDFQTYRWKVQLIFVLGMMDKSVKVIVCRSASRQRVRFLQIGLCRCVFKIKIFIIYVFNFLGWLNYPGSWKFDSLHECCTFRVSEKISRGKRICLRWFGWNLIWYDTLIFHECLKHIVIKNVR